MRIMTKGGILDVNLKYVREYMIEAQRDWIDVIGIIRPDDIAPECPHDGYKPVKIGLTACAHLHPLHGLPVPGEHTELDIYAVRERGSTEQN